MTVPDREDVSAAAAELWDVIVVGGGNAAIVAAMAARDRGCRVLLLERAEQVFRGGNSRHTRNVRCVHGGDVPWNTGPYSYDDLWRDLCDVGRGPSDEKIAALTVAESESAPPWMIAHGARFQPPLRGTLHLGRTNTFFLGGGKALLNSYYRHAAQSGVRVLYETKVVSLEFDGLRCAGVDVEAGGRRRRLAGRSVVCAAGGFEANIDWLAEHWGDAARNYIIRGPRYNDGAVLRELLSAGAAKAGDERGFHAVAVDARSPRFDGGLATRLDCIPFGIALNNRGERFYDEGEDLWPKRYAIWGGNIAGQPDQIAYCLWDAKVQGQFLPPMYGVTRAETVGEVAETLGLEREAATATVAAYNQAAPPDGAQRFDPARLDGVATSGLAIPKSNWAQRIDTPPFYGIAMRPGVTFTYMGVRVGADARVRTADGGAFANVFAAGEIMSGNILSTGYMAGFGMTIGTVWGRIAGGQAAANDDR